MLLIDKLCTSQLPWHAYNSWQGRDILVLCCGDGKKTALVLGTIHGDEWRTGEVVLEFSHCIFNNPHQSAGTRVVLVPVANPDGLRARTRSNHRGVDLNRNFPTLNWRPSPKESRYYGGPSPASEPETQVMIALIEIHKPDLIISFHSPLRVVNFDGPATVFAKEMGRATGYPLCERIGYETPGSLGTYAGCERAIPTVTMEIPAADITNLYEPNFRALFAALDVLRG